MGKAQLNRLIEKTFQPKKEWVADLGDGAGTVETGIPYLHYARLNGIYPIKVWNFVTPASNNLTVRVGYDELRCLFQVLSVLVRSGVSLPGGTLLTKHAESHQLNGGDPVYITDAQITPLLAYTTGGMDLILSPGHFTFNGTVGYVKHTQLDLTPNIPESGARYSLVTADVEGTISVVDGTPAASLQTLTLADAPAVPEENFPLALVRLYEGQTALSTAFASPDIIPLVWGSQGSGGGGGGEGEIIFPEAVNKTISSGYITISATDLWISLKAEGGAGGFDNLDGITGGVNGQVLVLFVTGSDFITLKHGVGNIYLNEEEDLLLEQAFIEFPLVRNQDNWCGFITGTGGSGGGDAGDITYTPAENTNWDGDADPGNVDAALDQLAERIDDEEGHSHAAPTIIRNISFFVSGALTVGEGEMEVENHFGETLTVLGVYLRCKVAPNGSDVTIDGNIDGTTMFTTQGNRPKITDGNTTGNSTTVENDQWADGAALRMDVDGIGSTDPGEGLMIVVKCTN